MAFEMASTNLVVELSIIMLVFLGWQFTLAEFVGAPLMVTFLVLLFRRFLRREMLDEAKQQADKGIVGRMEGHAAMDMSVRGGGSFLSRLMSPEGLTAVSRYFVMDWVSVWMDIVGGLLIAGALAAWVPSDFWHSFFLVNHPVIARIWGPIVGPLVAVITFVCSVGNIPLAAVLWNGGISFGGVIAFIFAALGLIPQQRNALVVEASVSWGYTTWLNIAFLALAAYLIWRFVRTGGVPMLKMMNRSEGMQTH